MNLNLDVLGLIFAQLEEADLAGAALVSRAFLAGALPSLYARVEYTARHVRRRVSPFATLAAHAHLVNHVRRIAVHAAPVFTSDTHRVCPAFLRDLAHALHAATSLRCFVCTVKILPPLLQPLAHAPALVHLRIPASLGPRQLPLLQQPSALRTLALDFPSWNVLDILPAWTAAMQRSLAHLTLFMSQDMDPAVLDVTLAHLPRLRGLHVIGCPRIPHPTVLKALAHMPDLCELSFTVFPSQENVPPPLNFPIPPLTHLSIDIRASYPGLKSLIARIISRLSPRDALAICGGWIGEISASSEQDPRPATVGEGGGAPNPHVDQPHGHANQPPLLSPPQPYHGDPNPIQNLPPDNQGPPLHLVGFPFPFPLAGDNNDQPADQPNPNPDLDLNWASLVASLPSTLSTLHLPQVSPTGLREVVDRCQGLELLGIAIGNAFATLESIRASRMPDRAKSHTLKAVGVRPEVNELASILSSAKVLRELIVDVSGADPGSGSGPKSGPPAGPPPAVFSPSAVRLLMHDSPRLRRIVAEGRVWESSTPTSLSTAPSSIELKLSKARCGPGTGNNHAHGPHGFGSHGVGYSQVEASNNHWFWLAQSASRF